MQSKLHKSKRSPCYDKLSRHISDEFTKLQEQHIEKWSFFKDFGIDDVYPNGKTLKIVGTAYEGTPSGKFWGPKYIPGYIDQIFDSCIEIVNQSSKDFGIHPNKCIQELEDLFLPKIAETYQRMAVIDSRLRGDGVKIPPLKDTRSLSENHQKEIKERLDRHRLKGLRNIGWWLNRFKWWISWIVGLILSLIKLTN